MTTRQPVDLSSLIKKNYNNDVDATISDIVVEIVNQGANENNITNGEALADKYCTALQGSSSKKVCGTRQVNKLNIAISSLPIYFIIAHSSVDIPLKKNKINRSTGKYVLDKSRPMFKQLTVADTLEESKYLINTTTSGAWGLLDASTCDIPSDHLLQENGQIIRNYLFSPDIDCENRINIYSMRETTRWGKELEKPTKKYPPSFNLPGTNYINKIHQFGGKKLSGSGFGIVKITSLSTGNAIDSLRKWENTLANDDTVFEHNIYFLTDKDGDIGSGEDNLSKGITQKDKAIWNLIKSKWNVNTYVDENGSNFEMGASDVKISDIIETGGPGIYISLSCSEYFFLLNGTRIFINEEDVNSPDIKLAHNISSGLKYIGDINRSHWDTFTKKLEFTFQTTRSGANPATASIQTMHDNTGVEGNERAAAISNSIASRVKDMHNSGEEKRGGKKRRRTRKRKIRKRRKTKKRSFVKKKTRKGRKRRTRKRKTSKK